MFSKSTTIRYLLFTCVQFYLIRILVGIVPSGFTYNLRFYFTEFYNKLLGIIWFCCRVGFDSHTLRFAARLINDNPTDATRYFIIKYFLCDDTIGIFELGERNSGFKVRPFVYFITDKFWVVALRRR